MANQIRLAFGKIILKSPKSINLIDYSYNVLEKTIPHKLSIKSRTIISFLDYKIEEVNGFHCLIGYYGYAAGDIYPIIDTTKKTLSEQKYIVPPFQGKALFLILESGYIIFEEKTESYIKPERIKDALESAFRAYAYEIPVIINFLELAESLETMVEFIYSLNSLVSLEFSDLKHSNPSEVSEFFDEAVIARINTIAESSDDPAGIDRKNTEFKNQIAHVRRYGKLRKAGGLAGDGFRVMELVQDKIRLTVTLIDQEVETKISKMLEIFNQLLNKLSIER